MYQVEQPLQVSTTVSQLLEQKEKNQTRERELKEKRARIKAFQGLPPVSMLKSHPSPYFNADAQMIWKPEPFTSISLWCCLSQNLELARHELRAARQKQMELIQLRERLLGRMADGVT